MNELIFNPLEFIQSSDQKMNKSNVYQSPNWFVDVYTLLPGQSQKPHTHADNDKLYYGLTGDCQVQLGDETRPLLPGQLAIAPAGVVHGILNDSSTTASVMVVMAPNPG
jgi:quercetin dioxygenase-like cupin family protein